MLCWRPRSRCAVVAAAAAAASRSLFGTRYLQSAFHVGNRDLACVRVDWLAQVGCADGYKWIFEDVLEDGDVNGVSKRGLIRIKLRRDSSICLTRRIDQGDPSPITLNHCTSTTRQLWKYTEKDPVTGVGTLSEPNEKLCFDNMQKKRGLFGLYGKQSASAWLVQCQCQFSCDACLDAC